jgi:predicted GNAT family acetyltransferase
LTFDEVDQAMQEAPTAPSAFEVTRRDASSIFGEGTERARYTDPQSGGTIEVVVRPDGSASVLELEVPEEFRGQGIGQRLQERVMQDFPAMGGQVSSRAAATTAYRLGRRPPGQPDATLEDVFKAIDENSSVNLISPEMQSRLAAPAPAASEPRIDVLGSAYGQTDARLTIPGIEGRIDYSVFEGRPKINMIEVPESARRQGNATRLLQALQNEFPGVEIDWGSLTEEGAALYRSTPFSEIPSQFSVSFDELNAARQRLRNIQSRWDRMEAEGTRAPAGFFEEWNALQDQIDLLEDQLRLESPSVRLIETQ